MNKTIILPELVISNPNIPRYFITPESNDDPGFTSYLGTKYYSHCELRKDQGSNSNSLQNTQQVNYNSIIFKSCLITIRQKKNIIKTEIQGRNGSIKEYISMGDYMITIEGLIVSEELFSPISFPKFEVDGFKEIMEFAGDSGQNNLDIICPLVNKFAQKVVVDEYELKEIQGSINTLEFTIELSSDDNPLNFDTASV
jgi:hypothetical protein